MVIPTSSKHQAAAETFINFMCNPEIAFRNADYIGYSSPHLEVQKMIDPELLSDPTAYPSDDLLTNYDIFHDLGNYLKVYDRIWTEIKAH
jgi:spermidine/putrescine transport system substrate-binding protein